MATSLARAMAQPWVSLEHIHLALIQPRKPVQLHISRRPTTVTRFAKRSVKQLGSEVGSRAWKPATRNGPGLMLWELLASVRQQIAQDCQDNPGSQAVEI
jgi:hypothetical protein